ncbi:winged helix-turn-helix domain-containing protein [Vibrio gigantis]|uniref:winged helix-turn-helix domain-containing protein n=1 Tax=Vibrio gigantis TaxID=296199 RepID=UPI003D0A8BCB
MLLYLNAQNDALEIYDQTLRIMNSVSLSLIEVNILQVLYKNVYKPCTRQELKQAGWPDRVVGPNSLNVCVMHLRKKLKSIIPDSEIRVVPSHGYKLLVPTTFHLINEGELPAITLKTNVKKTIEAQPEKILSSSVPTKSTQACAEYEVTSSKERHQKIRWEDLALTACIWLYAISLYHSIFN